MKKIVNITMAILIIGGIIFGTWSDREKLNDPNRDSSILNSRFCIYEHIESFLAGIIGIWAGVNLIYKPATLAKLLGKAASAIHIALITCFGLLWLAIGIFSFWNFYTSNLPYCGIS